MVIKLSEMEPTDRMNAITKYKARHRDALEDIKFRLYLIDDLTASYRDMSKRINDIQPSKKDPVEIKKNMYEMLVDIYSQIQKHIKAINSHVDNINFYAKQLNEYDAAKTKSVSKNGSVKTIMTHYPSIPYETIDKNDIFKKAEKIRIKVRSKNPKTNKTEFKFKDVVYNTIDLPTPEEIYDYDQRLDESRVEIEGEETDRKSKSPKKRGRPSKREVVNSTSAKQFGARIIKNATKLSGTNKITRKVNK